MFCIPRVTETPITHGHGREAEDRVSDRRKPEPYHRPAQRDAVRASLHAELSTHTYDREKTDD